MSRLATRTRGLASRLAHQRDAGEAFGSSIFIQVCLLASGVASARLLGPSDRGHLALFFVVHLTLSALGTLGTPMALTFAVARQNPGFAAVARTIGPTVLKQVLVLSCLDAAIMVGIALLGLAPIGPALGSAPVMPVMIFVLYGISYFQGTSEFRRVHLLRALPAALFAVGIIGCAVLGARSLMQITLVWVASYAAAASVTGFSVSAKRNDEHVGPEGEEIDLPELRRFGLRGLVGAVSPTEGFRIDQLIVGITLSSRMMGLYVAALAFTNLPRFLAQGLGLVAYPRVAAVRELSQQRRLLWRFTALGTLAGFVVAAPLILGAHVVMTTAFGLDFAAATTTAQILLLGSIPLCARRVMSVALAGAGAPGAGSRAELISWGALAPLLAIGVPLLGIEGVAIALSASYLVSLLALLVMASRLGLGVLSKEGPVPAAAKSEGSVGVDSKPVRQTRV